MFIGEKSYVKETFSYLVWLKIGYNTEIFMGEFMSGFASE